MRRRITTIVFSAILCAVPTAGLCDLAPYSQDFENLDQADTGALAADGWLVFGNVFTPSGIYLYGYGPFPAPNDGAAFCAIASGEGGPRQRRQQLSVYSDYNNGDHGNGLLIESNVFQEQIVGAADVGTTWLFDFDAKRGNIEGGTTALAFFKTLDPNAGFALTNFITLSTTDIPASWDSYQLSIYIDPSLAGQILQFGFLSTATNFEGSGIFYDNISFRPVTDQCHQTSLSVPSTLGTVEVCSKSEADALVDDEAGSVCVERNEAEVPCAGVCPEDGPCQCIVENYWNPRNNYSFKKSCSSALVANCPGGDGYVCDLSSVSYTCPCVCRVPGDPGGNNAMDCTP